MAITTTRSFFCINQASRGCRRHPDRRPRRIVCLRHGQCSRIARNVDDSAVGEPFKQLRYMSDIDGKLHTRPLAAAEPRNFLDKNPGDCSQASVRLLDSTRNGLLQFRIVSCLIFSNLQNVLSKPGRFVLAKQSSTILSTFSSTDKSPTCVLENSESPCASVA